MALDTILRILYNLLEFFDYLNFLVRTRIHFKKFLIIILHINLLSFLPFWPIYLLRNLILLLQAIHNNYFFLILIQNHLFRLNWNKLQRLLNFFALLNINILLNPIIDRLTHPIVDKVRSFGFMYKVEGQTLLNLLLLFSKLLLLLDFCWFLHQMLYDLNSLGFFLWRLLLFILSSCCV